MQRVERRYITACPCILFYIVAVQSRTRQRGAMPALNLYNFAGIEQMNSMDMKEKEQSNENKLNYKEAYLKLFNEVSSIIDKLTWAHLMAETICIGEDSNSEVLLTEIETDTEDDKN